MNGENGVSEEFSQLAGKYEEGMGAMIAPFESRWPPFLARQLQARGVHSALVWRGDPTGTEALNVMPCLDATEHEKRMERFIRHGINRYMGWIEPAGARFWAKRYSRVTGRTIADQKKKPGVYEWQFLKPYLISPFIARKVRSLNPRFVLGHRVTLTGRAVSLCHGIPKILYPHGADIYYEAESSPFLFSIVKQALLAADLIMVGTEDAQKHLVNRYGVDEKVIQVITGVVDLDEFKPASDQDRKRICQKWDIDPSNTILTNMRRFHPEWGCWVAMDVFLEIAKEQQNVSFILAGGKHANTFYPEAKRKVEEAGLANRFCFLPATEIPIGEFAEVLSITDIGLSLRGRGDLRAMTVLQSAACGVQLILADLPDHRTMKERGYCARLVDPKSVKDVYAAIKEKQAQPFDVRQACIAANEEYLKSYHSGQNIDLLTEKIDEMCNSYRYKREAVAV